MVSARSTSAQATALSAVPATWSPAPGAAWWASAPRLAEALWGEHGEVVLRCVQRPGDGTASAGKWGFAHVCARCGAVGPIRGLFEEVRDEAEAKALGSGCDGGPWCSAAAEGWQTGGEVDLCAACRPRGVSSAVAGSPPQSALAPSPRIGPLARALRWMRVTK